MLLKTSFYAIHIFGGDIKSNFCNKFNTNKATIGNEGKIYNLQLIVVHKSCSLKLC
jgi:hypothetical protein